MKIRKISRRRPRCSFAEDAKEMYNDIYNARAQLLFCSLNLLFGDGLVAVVVVVYLKGHSQL